LWAWGNNDYGQLGDGTTTNRSFPVQIGSDTNWSAISAGERHSVGLKSDGTLWGWGKNDYGELGDGTTIQRNSPIQESTGATNWSTIATANTTTIALKSNGTLWTMGSNIYGEIGDGTTTHRAIPTQIGSDSNWSAIDGGSMRIVALKSNGTLWSWGRNWYGEIGIGSTTDWNEPPVATPTQIGSDSNWSAIASGFAHTIALKSNGTLWAWGKNEWGPIGDGTLTNRTTPKQIGSGYNGATIEAGGDHNIVLKSDGTLWTWGHNNSGQIGDGTNIIRTSPVQIGANTNWSHISAGGDHTFALEDD